MQEELIENGDTQRRKFSKESPACHRMFFPIAGSMSQIDASMGIVEVRVARFPCMKEKCALWSEGEECCSENQKARPK